MREYRDYMTADVARSLFEYDATNGGLINKVTRRKARVGRPAGYARKDGYWTMRARYTNYLVHRVVWLVVYGEWPSRHIDHIDQNPSNNRIENLRLCNDAENAQNLSPKGYGTSGYLGVTAYIHDPSKWVAKIKVAQKSYNLGVYNCRTAAYAAYCKAKVEMHPFAAGGAA